MQIGNNRQRILVEDEDPAWHRLVAGLAAVDEYEFDYCRGPLLVEGGCPILQGGACPKMEWADSILYSLDQREPCNAALLEALRGCGAGVIETALSGQPPTICLTRCRRSGALV
jgi:hypothetical protein